MKQTINILKQIRTKLFTRNFCKGLDCYNCPLKNISESCELTKIALRIDIELKNYNKKYCKECGIKLE